MRRCGFTLIEVMAVVLLIGLLAGAVAWSMVGTVQDATRQEVLEKLAHADANARMSARRLGPSALQLDLDTQQLWVVTPDLETNEPRRGHVIQLAPNYRIAEVNWLGTSARVQGQDGAYEDVRRDDGLVELAMSSAGLSRTYVLKIVGPGVDPDEPSQQVGEVPSWLLVSGLTGQVTIHEDPETIDKLLELLASARADAG